MLIDSQNANVAKRAHSNLPLFADLMGKLTAMIVRYDKRRVGPRSRSRSSIVANAVQVGGFFLNNAIFDVWLGWVVQLNKNEKSKFLSFHKFMLKKS